MVCGSGFNTSIRLQSLEPEAVNLKILRALLQEAARICKGKARPVMDVPSRDKESLRDAIAKVSSQTQREILFHGMNLAQYGLSELQIVSV